MKKIILYTPIILFVGVFGYLVIANSDSPDFRAINYHLPEDFEGCAVILYDQEDAPPLTISDGKEIDIVFDENGFFKTSSPKDFGWQSEENSGFHDAKYFSGGEPLEREEIHSHNSGSHGGEDAQDIQHESISVKIKDACQIDLVVETIEKNIEK